MGLRDYPYAKENELMETIQLNALFDNKAN